MLVDDDGDFRETLAECLGALDWIDVVGTAADGAGAVRLFSQRAPDVVVMDLVMPGMDGVEATARSSPPIRRRAFSSSPPRTIIACWRSWCGRARGPA